MSRGQLVVIDASDAPHVPSNEQREMVTRAIACGLDHADIAFLLQVDLLTLRKHYGHELEHGLAYHTARVGSALIDSALRGDSNAQRFFLQTRARWNIPTKVELDARFGEVEKEERARLMDSILGMVVGKQAEKVKVDGNT